MVGYSTERGRTRQDICEERQASSMDCAKLSVSGVRDLKMCSSKSTGGVGERIRLEAIDTGARFSDCVEECKRRRGNLVNGLFKS